MLNSIEILLVGGLLYTLIDLADRSAHRRTDRARRCLSSSEVAQNLAPGVAPLHVLPLDRDHVG